MKKDIKVDLATLSKKAIIVAFLGGIISYIVTTTIGSMIATGIGQIIGSIILLVLLIALAKKATFDDLNLFHMLILLFAVGIVGSILSLSVPFISAYVLSVSNFTLTGLMWTVFYVMVAEIIAGKYMK